MANNCHSIFSQSKPTNADICFIRFWITGEPDNWKKHEDEPGEDCSGTDGKYNGWYDDSCEKWHRFVCEALSRY